MCGRYVNKLGEVQYSFFEINDIRIEWRPRYNIAPTVEIPVVRQVEPGHRELVGMRWGLRPSWATPEKKLPPLHNAREDTVAKLPSFRSAFKTRRCLVPASGYFEWAKATKQPYYFERKDGFPMAFAAIWEHNKDVGDTVSTITTVPNGEASRIHDRMPVILRREFWPRWFDPSPLTDEEREKMLVPAPDGALNIWPVTRAVGNSRNEGSELILPISGDEIGTDAP